MPYGLRGYGWAAYRRGGEVRKMKTHNPKTNRHTSNPTNQKNPGGNIGMISIVSIVAERRPLMALRSRVGVLMPYAWGAIGVVAFVFLSGKGGR